MKALLVSMGGAPVTPSYFMPDNGLAGLAGCLLEAGHDVEVLDLNTLETMDRLFPEELRPDAKEFVTKRIERKPLTDRDIEQYDKLEKRLDLHRTAEFDKMGAEVAKHTAKSKAQLVGFKLWSGDGWTGSIQLARAVRNELGDKVLIVGGGSQVDYYRDVLLEQVEPGVFDALSVAEGEPTILGLSEHIEKKIDLNKVPNLLLPGTPLRQTRIERVKSLGDLPRPCYDEDIYPQKGRMRIATFEETRGCPHKCAFCAHPLKAGNKRRDCPPDRVVEDMIWLQEKYGFRGFKLGGSYTPSNYMRKLCGEIISRGLCIPFCSYGRISDAKNSDFALYRKAGCEALFFGLESGSQILLDRSINKGHRVPDSVRVLKASKSAGIYTLASVIFPNVGETAKTRRATLDILNQIKPNGVPLMYPVPLPYTRWFIEPKRYGFQIDDPETYIREAAIYKIRILLPFSFWHRLNYRISGKPFDVFTKETEAFADEVRVIGSIIHMSDELVLFAALSGYPAHTLLDKTRISLLCGNVEQTATIVAEVNNPQ